MTDRLSKLMAMLEREPGDPFLLYSIGLEHKTAGRLDEAVAWLDRTIGADAGYCYAYYQKGQVMEAKGDVEAAKGAYLAGIAAAKAKGDGHAQGELEGAMEMMG